jgi:putative aminopeptidase FrvX
LTEHPQHPNVVYAGATVQEEVGSRGARTSSHLIDPDVFFALDASPANDVPGSRESFGRLGGGLLLRIYDPTTILMPRMRDFLVDLCEKEQIPYQYFVAKGGTDAKELQFHGKGTPGAVIGIPARYIHSHAAIINEDDYFAAKRLLFAAVNSLDKSTLETILGR